MNRFKSKYGQQLNAAWNDRSFHDWIGPGRFCRDDFPVIVVFDELRGYEEFGHPLCVFVPNAYPYENWRNVPDFYAITVSEDPQIIHSPKYPMIAPAHIMLVIQYVRTNLDILKRISDSGNSDELMYCWFGRNESVNESLVKVTMRNIGVDVSNLPYPIRIDGGSSPKHPNRIKIEYQRGKYVCMDLYGRIVAGDASRLKKREIEIFRKFVNTNRSVLNMFLNNAVYDGNDIPNILTYFDDDGNPVPPKIENINPEVEFIKGRYLKFGMCELRFKNLKSKINVCLMDDSQMKPVYLDESGKPMEFDYISDFSITENNIFACATAGESEYILYLSGKYEKL